MSSSGALAVTTRVLVISAALLAATAVVLASNYGHDLFGYGLAALAVAALSIPLVGAAVARNDPRNPVGWLLLTTGVTLPLALAADLYSHAAYAGATLPAAQWVGWLDDWPWAFALALVPLVLLFIFPTGRVDSRLWIPFLWIGIAIVVAQLASTLFSPTLSDFPHVANPTALPGLAGEIASGLGITIAVVPILATVAALSVHLRWWRSPRGSDERSALGLVVPAGWLIAASWWACFVIDTVTGDSSNALGAEMFGMVTLAVTAWIAIRRVGLFGTRQVFSAALVYAALIVCVLIVYVVVGAGVELIASTAVSGPIAVLVAVAVAVPLRDGLRRLANRLVYGDRDEPYSALTRLGRRMEDSAAPADVLPGVARTMREALRLPYVGVQFHEAIIESGRPSEQTEQLPLVFAGENVGALILGQRERNELLSSGERQLLASVAAQVAAAVHAVSLTQDLQRSRERLVTSTEDERLRMSRDLHDGLGSRLAGLVLGLKRARGQLSAKDAGVAAQLDSMTVQTQDAIAEVRRLIYDLRPPALDELGLVGALGEQARVLGSIEVRGPAQEPRLSAAIEVAAYRIAMEAMTNIARHAHATRSTVDISVDTSLRLEISDDGDGLPAAYRAGIGITSMRERAAELGGECTIVTTSPGGTTIRAVIPLEYA